MVDWLKDEVAKPFVSGTGVLQVASNFTENPVQWQAPASTNKLEWGVQTLSGAAGALLVYVPFGKATGGALSALGRSADRALIAAGAADGLPTAAAKLFASESAGQILGAGVYESLKKPGDGETRLGGAIGVMASFSAYELGNRAILPALGNTAALAGARRYLQTQIGDTATRATGATALGAGRYLVGGIGGETSYEVSHAMNAWLTGTPNTADNDGRIDAIATGGFINLGLPAAQRLAGKGIDKLTNSSWWGRGAAQPDALPPGTDAQPWVEGNRAGTPPSGTAPDTTSTIEAKLPGNVHVDGVIAPDTPGNPVPPPAESRATAPVVADPTGTPDKLGATVMPGGVNFGVEAAAEATGMELLLFDKPDATTPSQVLPMFRTGETWHRFVPQLNPGALYLYRADGPWIPQQGLWFNPNHALIDPFVKAVTGDTNRPLTYDMSNPTDPNRIFTRSNRDNIADMPKGVVIDDAFDWQGVKPPIIPPDNLLVAEIQVRGLTANDQDVPEHLRGTYAGVVEKIGYFKRLGINAVKVMPTDAFDSHENGKINDWGYQPWNYLSPKPGLAADKSLGGAVNEYKYMVRELQRNGIMVISDEVFNHSSEGNEFGPTISFRGLDNVGYYMLNPANRLWYEDHTGVGNTFNPASPRVQKLVLEALKYKFLTMRLDGIRYDLGSFMSRDPQQTLMRAIQNDPVLSRKMHIQDPNSRKTTRQDIVHILEAWDIHQNLEGRMPWQQPSESGTVVYNESGAARDTIRAAVKGDVTINDHGMMWALDRLIKGRPVVGRRGDDSVANAYDDPKTVKPLIFTFSHDGQTLTDNDMYQGKYNDRPGQDNGEGNRDGDNNNLAWNHGVEGATDDPRINRERRQTEDNKWILNLLPVGTMKMIRLGDESRQTKRGNNNTYPQVELNNMDWDLVQKNADTVDRRARMSNYLVHEQKLGALKGSQVDSYGTHGDWHNFEWGSRAIAWQFRGTADGAKRLFVMSNNYWDDLDFKLPPGDWRVVEDTSMSDDQVLRGTLPAVKDTYKAKPRSLIVLETDEPISVPSDQPEHR